MIGRPLHTCATFRMLWRLCLMILALIVPLTTVMAQETEQQRLIRTWEQTADRAQEALEKAQASSDAFEVLRVELADQRAQAEVMAGEGRIAIRALKAQLETLGPAPAKDQTEPAVIAERRAYLTEALTKAEQPALAARQAVARAEVLIEEIDSLVRSRSTFDLFAQKPSPLDPSSWTGLTGQFGHYYDKVAEDTRHHYTTQEAKAEGGLEERMILALVLVAFVLLVPLGGGHLVLVRLERRLKGRPGSAAFLAKAAGIHGLRIALNLLAGSLLLAALVALDLGPTTAHGLTGAVFIAICIFVITSLVGNILFAPNQVKLRLIDVADDLARACYWLSLSFATALSVEVLVDGMAEDFAFAEANLTALQAISIVINILVLVGLARVLLAVARRLDEKGTSATEDEALGPGFLRVSARTVQVLGVLAFVATVAGFVPLARAVLAPIMLSLTLVGFAYILHHAVMVPIAVTFRRHPSTASIISVVIAIALVLAGIPLLALIWGARAADVQEVWRIIQNGIDIGGARLSPKVLIVLVTAFLIGLFLTRWLQRIVDRVVLPKTRIDRGGRNAINTGLGYVGVIVSALLAISAAGLDLSNLAIIAGALSVGVGFGLQAIVSNFVSGIILLIERPIKEGDWIEVSGYSGVVRKIAVRSTRIETFDRHDVIIPNADLISGTVKNRTLSSRFGRLLITLRARADADVAEIRLAFAEVAKTIPAILPTPEPQVFVTKIDSSAQELELRCFLRDVGTEVGTRSDLLIGLNQALRRDGNSPLV